MKNYSRMAIPLLVTLLSIGLTIPITATFLSSDFAAGSLTNLGRVRTLTVQGDYAYLGITDKIVIVDISNPLAPVQLGETGRLLAPYGDVNEEYQCTGMVYDIAVIDNYAYVPADTGGIQVIDVGDPLHPQVIGNHRHIGSISIALTDTALVEAQNICLMQIGTTGGYIRIYEVATPATLIEIGSIFHAGFGYSQSQIAVLETHVYAASENGSTLEIVSINDPSSHISYSWLNQPDWPGGFTPISLAAHGHYLYVSAAVWSGDPLLVVFDISDPVRPVWVNSFDMSAITSMVIENDKLYLAHGLTIDVYDLTDPMYPNSTLSYTLERLILDIDVQGTCIYAGTSSGLQIFCTNDPVVTPTPSLTPPATPSPTPTTTPSLTPTSTPTLTPTHAPSLTPTSTVTPMATNTPTPILPLTPTPSPTSAVEQWLYLPLIRSDGS